MSDEPRDYYGRALEENMQLNRPNPELTAALAAQISEDMEGYINKIPEPLDLQCAARIIRKFLA